MELLPPSVFKEEFHANSQIEVDWNRGENSSHHSSSNKPEFSQGIKNESKKTNQIYNIIFLTKAKTFFYYTNRHAI